MLRKMLAFLFEEEEIIEEVPEKADEPTIIEPVTQKRVSRIDVDEEEPKKTTPGSQTIQIEESSFEDEPKIKPEITIKKEPLPPIREKKQRTEVEYEFSTAISPIFGKLKKEEKEPIVVQPKIAFEESESVLGTIISPIYGIKKTGKNQKVEKTKTSPPKPMSIEDILGMTEEHPTINEQLDLGADLTKSKPKEKEELLMQLFEEESE